MKKHMSIKAALNRFTACQSGAITVDWVVLTAALVGFGAVTASVVLIDAGDNFAAYGQAEVSALLND